ncbi:hypothetical protein SHKM778_10380 [Streptomyces sp. KM77-8]|uniref:Uncharacterized protein n=1 Tax=Streptomyces haneummycinicus TaxID=3074435 RepID=A0AAT9HB89_9ACTN
MNDRHPSGTMAPAPASDAAAETYASYGTQEAQYGDFTTYGGYDTTGYDATHFGTGAHTAGGFPTDPSSATCRAAARTRVPMRRPATGPRAARRPDSTTPTRPRIRPRTTPAATTRPPGPPASSRRPR